ncbi:MAG: Eco57I restriction-modification methylase domain-containing protein [Sulfurihydrogenibium sp.]|jgi:hypothetical protein|nr:Eco57I restriction-modification methylase domain-containing protein [Sulfurihydrogenibium sp.]
MKKLSNLINNFSLKNLEEYLLSKGFTINTRPIDNIQDIKEKYHISDAYEIGHTKLKQNTDLITFAIKLNNITEKTSKKNQLNIAKELLKKHQKTYGLFVFYDNNKNFRLSFIFKTAYNTNTKDNQYKRFTFHINPNLPNKTIIKQLKKCNFTDLDSIKKAFNIQSIAKDFYNDLLNWYYYALDKVEFPDNYKHTNSSKKDKEPTNTQNLIKLLIRLIFIWFLKEKNLIPDELFDEKHLKNTVKDFGKSSNYYSTILQNLFLTISNKPIEEDKFLTNKEEASKLFKNIPPTDCKLFDLDSEEKQAKINDDLFLSNEKTADLSKYGLSKKAKVKGLINILKSYNFTTEESTPTDQEIAIDPEILGTIFENFLANHSPKEKNIKEKTARKLTGSYYTPKEIADYMIEESLKEYLKTKVPEAEDILNDLFSYSNEKLEISDNLRKKLIKTIDQVKIIDPACGSGVFLISTLHKLVFLLQKLDPSNKIWKEIQLEKEKPLEEINKIFNENTNYPDYARKFYLIENCIYGVDIQLIPTQISKLRLIISLISDQKTDKEKPNFKIFIPQNLKTKIIPANILIGIEEPNQKPLKNQEITKLLQKLKLIRHKYFKTTSTTEKNQLQNKDKELREKLKDTLINNSWNDKTTEKIANFDIFNPNTPADWFDPEWMFGITDGFDITISNPPYIRQQRIKSTKLALQNQNYEVFTPKADLYVCFYEKGYRLLKEQGILTYITSNKWMRAKYGERLRKFLKEKTTILKIIDFNGHNIFKQTVIDTNIIIFKKEKPNEKHTFKFLEIKGNTKNIEEHLKQNTWQTAYQNKLSDIAWNLEQENQTILNLRDKIKKTGKPLKNWNIETYVGIITGLNKAFVIDNKKRDEILKSCKTEEERRKTEDIIKPIIKGRDIEKYRYKWKGKWLIYTHQGINIEEYPSIKSHLIQFKDQLEKRTGGATWDKNKTKIISIPYKWYEVETNQYAIKEIFKGEKAVWSETSDKIKMTIVPPNIYPLKTCSVLIGNNLRLIIGIANSKLIDWYIKQSIHRIGEKSIYISNYFIEQLPFPSITKENQPVADQITQKVDQILTLTQSEDYGINQEKQHHVKKLEHEINQLVYQLYNLTEEEIKIIENT